MPFAGGCARLETTRGVEMTSISHERAGATEVPSWINARDMWASLAIISIWVAVLFTAIFGPNMLTHDAGGSEASIPSVVIVALLAVFATWAVARHGFAKSARDN